MADEMEKYLKGRLDDAICEVEKSEKRLSSKLNQLKVSLAPGTSIPLTIDRKKLYNLNNLLSERLSEKQSPVKSVLRFLKCANNLDNIIEDLPKDAVGTVANTSPPSQSGAVGSSNSTARGTEVYRWSTGSVDREQAHGPEDKWIFLVRLIVDQPHREEDTVFRAFGLVGMQGIGKTTLAQMVFNHTQVREHFLPRIWVCVSKQPWDDIDPRKEIVKRMLRCLGVDDEDIDYADRTHQLNGLLYALRRQLLGKRYLIVLDDVWIAEKDYLDFVSSLSRGTGGCEGNLAYGLPKDFGGAVIVTSRSRETAGRMVGADNLREVLPLSDEDCWKIFKETYEEEGNSLSGNLTSLELKVKEKCSGLPLAAKMMGEIARKPKASAPDERQQNGDLEIMLL